MTNEVFDTGLRKISHELKSQLASHGLYGTLTELTTDSAGSPPIEAGIEVTVKGRVARRSFQRQEIESCYLRVNGAVLKEIAAIVEELAH